MRRKKRFDCVELQHRGALAIYAETKDMTIDEQVAYWRQQRRKLGRELGVDRLQRDVGDESAAASRQPVPGVPGGSHA
jgi:hypothetical protein